MCSWWPDGERVNEMVITPRSLSSPHSRTARMRSNPVVHRLVRFVLWAGNPQFGVWGPQKAESGGLQPWVAKHREKGFSVRKGPL